MSTIEQRRFARIETSLECTVVTERDDFPARVANLSRTGAGLIAPPARADVGSSLMLLFERSEGAFSFALPSRVMRVSARADDAVYGVQFDVVPPEVSDELLRLLKTLTQEKGQGRRDSPRVAARVKVRCKSRTAFVAQLNDLSLGGLSVRSAQDVETGSTLTVQVGVDVEPSLLTLSGKVLRSTPSADGWVLSLKFDPPDEAERAQVLLLLDVLLGLGPRGSALVEG